MKKGMVLLTIVAFALTFAMPALCAEQTVQGAPKLLPIPQVPVGAIAVPTEINGRITHFNLPAWGVPLVEVRLFMLSGRGSLVAHTDSAGKYSFRVSVEHVGKNYKIVPKYPTWAPGVNFTPEEKTFTLASGINKIDFVIAPPNLSIESCQQQMVSNDLFVVTIVVRNRGSVPSSPYKMQVYHKKGYSLSTIKTKADYDFPGLSAGGTKVFALPNRYATNDANFFWITIDTIDELDGTDNEKECLFLKET